MRSILAVLLLAVSTGFAATDVNSAAYKKDYAQWMAGHDASLRKNWLVVVGLSWLKEGTNRVGGDHKLEVPLPEDRVPAQVGTIEFHSGKATFTALHGAKVANDGKPVTKIDLRPDTTEHPTVLQIGDVRMYLIQREKKFGIRVKDAKSKFLAGFHGAKYFPVAQQYVVTANYIPYPKPKKVMIPTVIGQDAEIDSLGQVEFTLNGQKQHLQVLSEGGDELFFIIKDQTSGHGTYPAGRFLYSGPPKNGKVELDFNRAYNPPCAWTPYATCPLPPKENYMTVKVEAGEKFQGHH